MSVNVVHNDYKPGPATQPAVARCIAKIDDNLAKYATFEPRWHIEGNVVARIATDTHSTPHTPTSRPT